MSLRWIDEVQCGWRGALKPIDVEAFQDPSAGYTGVDRALVIALARIAANGMQGVCGGEGCIGSAEG